MWCQKNSRSCNGGLVVKLPCKLAIANPDILELLHCAAAVEIHVCHMQHTVNEW